MDGSQAARLGVRVARVTTATAREGDAGAVCVAGAPVRRPDAGPGGAHRPVPDPGCRAVRGDPGASRCSPGADSCRPSTSRVPTGTAIAVVAASLSFARGRPAQRADRRAPRARTRCWERASRRSRCSRPAGACSSWPCHPRRSPPWACSATTSSCCCGPGREPSGCRSASSPTSRRRSGFADAVTTLIELVLIVLLAARLAPQMRPLTTRPVRFGAAAIVTTFTVVVVAVVTGVSIWRSRHGRVAGSSRGRPGATSVGRPPTQSGLGAGLPAEPTAHPPDGGGQRRAIGERPWSGRGVRRRARPPRRAQPTAAATDAPSSASSTIARTSGSAGGDGGGDRCGRRRPGRQRAVLRHARSPRRHRRWGARGMAGASPAEAASRLAGLGGAPEATRRARGSAPLARRGCRSWPEGCAKGPRMSTAASTAPRVTAPAGAPPIGRVRVGRCRRPTCR